MGASDSWEIPFFIDRDAQIYIRGFSDHGTPPWKI